VLALIPLAPFAGFLLNAALGRRLSKRASGGVACAAMIAAFALAVASVAPLLSMAPEARFVRQTVYTWIASGSFEAPLALHLDPLSAVMILVVTGIGSLIHIYSTAYMQEESDAEFARYFSYLNLFAAFMLLLVLGANLAVLFVGWEGVGLCSYLLIGFWHGKKSASDAGKKAFIVNRIGDVGFVLGMLLAFREFGTLDVQAIAGELGALAPEAAFGAVSAIALLLFVGATGKSAQIPLYVWLPDAMEGPTPVSALIHAATMVTAGVYVIGRNAVLFSHAPDVLALVAVIGAVTAFMAATIGLVQNDIKRVLAYSTVSQLGYMFMAMGVGAFAAGIFHLVTHAFFKALLFLGSGAVIHALAGEQDLRRMGGLRGALPLTYWTFLVGALAIAGVPGLAGFFSKDEILFRTFASGHVYLWALAAAAALMTAVYMFRVVFLVFHGSRVAAAAAVQGGHGAAPAPHASAPARPPDGDQGHGPAGGPLHDAPAAMALALIVLAMGTVLAGYIGVSHGLGGDNRIADWLAPSFAPPARDAGAAAWAGQDHGALADVGLERIMTLVSTLVALGGIGLAAVLYLRRPETAEALRLRFPGIYRLLLNKYYVDEIYDAALIQPVRIVSEEGLWRGVDARLIDGAVNGMGASVQRLSGLMRRLQTGSVRGYAASVLVGVLVIVGYYLWR
jgi:NADH-quinone oxidoreductase subunit L